MRLSHNYEPLVLKCLKRGSMGRGEGEDRKVRGFMRPGSSERMRSAHLSEQSSAKLTAPSVAWKEELHHYCIVGAKACWSYLLHVLMFYVCLHKIEIIRYHRVADCMWCRETSNHWVNSWNRILWKPDVYTSGIDLTADSMFKFCLESLSWYNFVQFLIFLFLFSSVSSAMK